jgi:F-type H+-transporting ATPase subunit b
MPQIDQIPEFFASQLFWLVVTFGLIYLVIGRMMLPKIEGTVELRDRRIADDLAAAEAARNRADAIEEDYRARMDAGRAEAMKLTHGAKEASGRETEARLTAADAEIHAKVDSAEAEIRDRVDAALGEIEAVAAEAAQQMVARLSGTEVDRKLAEAAVKEAMAHG